MSATRLMFLLSFFFFFALSRLKDSMAAVLDPSHKTTSAPKKRANKSISPPECGRVKPFRTQDDAAKAIPSAMLQTEAKEQHQGCWAGTSKGFPTLATAEARKLHAPMSLASLSSTGSKKLGAVASAVGVPRASFDDLGGKDGRGTSEESKKPAQATKSSAERRCNGFPPRWSCLLLLALVAVLLTAVALAFLVYLLDGAKDTPIVRVCHTHECHEYGRRLSSSLNESVRPCDSFTQFVCDGWRRENELGTYELLVAQGLESVTRTLDAITVPQARNSP
ncbi:uncharacterized protein LOC125947187 [Dermacentor silvarum]|uniref:uncharacterized protein LOC125947187 n=1 Tax=Dermacentor silvarum TaxID=543639 RepID=UPI00210079EB|nr:uncharacterized protein LOC125947187 [Dermacentor silvarum]